MSFVFEINDLKCLIIQIAVDYIYYLIINEHLGFLYDGKILKTFCGI